MAHYTTDEIIALADAQSFGWATPIIITIMGLGFWWYMDGHWPLTRVLAIASTLAPASGLLVLGKSVPGTLSQEVAARFVVASITVTLACWATVAVGYYPAVRAVWRWRRLPAGNQRKSPRGKLTTRGAL